MVYIQYFILFYVKPKNTECQQIIWSPKWLGLPKLFQDRECWISVHYPTKQKRKPLLVGGFGKMLIWHNSHMLYNKNKQNQNPSLRQTIDYGYEAG